MAEHGAAATQRPGVREQLERKSTTTAEAPGGLDGLFFLRAEGIGLGRWPRPSWALPTEIRMSLTDALTKNPPSRI